MNRYFGFSLSWYLNKYDSNEYMRIFYLRSTIIDNLICNFDNTTVAQKRAISYLSYTVIALSLAINKKNINLTSVTRLRKQFFLINFAVKSIYFKVFLSSYTVFINFSKVICYDFRDQHELYVFN